MVECADRASLRTQSHNGWVWWVDCSPDEGQLVLIKPLDCGISTGKLIKTLHGQYGVQVVLFTSDRRTLISSDEARP